MLTEDEEDEEEGGRKRSGFGTRHDESLPWARGEGFIAGSWKMEDVVATTRSFGARAEWDQRFDCLQSATVAQLNETDTLQSLHIKGSFPVGDRDASVVTTFECKEEGVGYVATTSVKDPLIPVRTTSSLSSST